MSEKTLIKHFTAVTNADDMCVLSMKWGRCYCLISMCCPVLVGCIVFWIFVVIMLLNTKSFLIAIHTWAYKRN